MINLTNPTRTNLAALIAAAAKDEKLRAFLEGYAAAKKHTK